MASKVCKWRRENPRKYSAQVKSQLQCEKQRRAEKKAIGLKKLQKSLGDDFIRILRREEKLILIDLQRMGETFTQKLHFSDCLQVFKPS